MAPAEISHDSSASMNVSCDSPFSADIPFILVKISQVMANHIPIEEVIAKVNPQIITHWHFNFGQREM